MACIELYAAGQKIPITLKSKDLATHGFQKKIPDTPTKTCWSQAQSQKVSLPPAKLCMLYLAHL